MYDQTNVDQTCLRTSEPVKVTHLKRMSGAVFG